MNRYAVFAGSDYYPLGGFDDFVADFKNLSSALKFVETIHEVGINEEAAEWCHIIDMNRKEKLVSFERECEISESDEIKWSKWEEVSEN